MFIGSTTIKRTNITDTLSPKKSELLQIIIVFYLKSKSIFLIIENESQSVTKYQ